MPSRGHSHPLHLCQCLTWRMWRVQFLPVATAVRLSSCQSFDLRIWLHIEARSSRSANLWAPYVPKRLVHALPISSCSSLPYCSDWSSWSCLTLWRRLSYEATPPSAERTLRLTPTLRGSLATLDHLGSLPPCYTRKLAAPTSDPKEKHIRWLSFQIFQIFQTSNSQPSTGEIPTAPLEIKHLEIELWIWSILCAASSGTAHAF